MSFNNREFPVDHCGGCVPEWVDVFKDPITDPGKSSKKGRVTLYKNENGYFSGLIGDYENDELYTVFENGKLIQEWSFDEIRENSNKE